MLLVAVSLWLIARPYQGIFHDAYLYTLQALGYLRPDTLGQDIFLRFGSQDAYTVFSPLYAAFIAWLGVEPAARLLTFVAHAWWAAAAWLLALSLTGRRWLAWLGLALALGLPGYYGAHEVFQFAEPFLTPRVFSEAAVLSAFALQLRGRRIAAAVSVGLAMAFHPLMGAAGALTVGCLAIGKRGPALTMLGAIVSLGIVLVVATVHPIGPIALFDDTWLQLVRQHSPFLTMADWNAESWEGAFTSIAALILACRALGPGDRATVLLRVALLVGMVGLAVTAVGATLFKVVVITQGQAWRWTWVGLALVTLSAPRWVPELWKGGHQSRAALLLFASSWMLVGWPAVFLAAGSVLASAATVLSGPRASRITLLVATGVAGASLLAWGVKNLFMSNADPSALDGSPVLAWVRAVTADGVVPAATAVIASYAISRATGRWLALICAVATATTAAVLTQPFWQRTQFDEQDRRALQSWRAAIPAGAEVLWASDPSAVWLLLDRQSYMSGVQTAGILFSHRAAMEMLERARKVSLILPPRSAFSASIGGRPFNVSAAGLLQACEADGGPGFVVAIHALGPGAVGGVASVHYARSTLRNEVHLYDCGLVRRHRDAYAFTTGIRK